MTIKITGLGEFTAALAELENGLPRARDAALAAAGDLVLTDARRRVPSRTGRARGSLRLALGDAKVTVVGGNSRAPYFGWLDFGGRVGKSRGVNRPYLGDGRYVYFAHQQMKARYLDILSKALVDAVRDAGLEVD